MTTIVVGGHSRNVGKTAVAAGLIHAFKNYPWTAIKITSHQHGGIRVSGGDDKGDICSIHEEIDSSGASDTSRFLAAGAFRALWVRIRDDFTDTSLQPLLPILQSSTFTIIESNRILRVLHPDVFIMVLKYDVEDFKASARSALRQAHAVVAVNSDSSLPRWEGISPEMLSDIPQFAMVDFGIIPSGLLDFVRSRLPR
jgi:hypothetical protein